MQSLMRQINLLNCILLTGILMFGYFVLQPIFTKEVKVPLSPTKPKLADQQKEVAEQAINPPLQGYAVVAETNLFHPDRIIPTKKVEIVIPRPEFVLYGTLIADKVSIAYMSDKKAVHTTLGRGQRQTSLKIGETMSGYTLREVLHDRVVMVRGDNRIEVKVTSTESRQNKGAPGGPTTPVTSQIVPSMTPSASPAQTPGTGGNAIRTRTH
jgi:type II secretory pathway component PulC